MVDVSNRQKILFYRRRVKAKLFLCRPREALWAPVGRGCQEFCTVDTWKRQACHRYVLTALIFQEIFPVLISVRGLVDHSGAGRGKSLKLNDPITNRTRDLPDCSTVPKPLWTPRRRRIRCIIGTKYKFKTNSFDISDPKSAACSWINWLIFNDSSTTEKKITWFQNFVLFYSFKDWIIAWLC
jgi:hypothetical protein